MSKKNEIQQTLDAKLFKPYEVSERKVSFGGGVTVDASITSQLQPHQTYLAVVKVNVSAATIKFGDATSGALKLEVTSIEKLERLEPVSVIDGETKDDPRPEPEPAADPETSVFKDQPTVDEVVADQEAEDAAALEAEAEEPEDDEIPEPSEPADEEPEPVDNVVSITRDIPDTGASVTGAGPECFGTWEAIPECDGCALEADCKAAAGIN